MTVVSLHMHHMHHMTVVYLHMHHMHHMTVVCDTSPWKLDLQELQTGAVLGL